MGHRLRGVSSHPVGTPLAKGTQRGGSTEGPSEPESAGGMGDAHGQDPPGKAAMASRAKFGGWGGARV